MHVYDAEPHRHDGPGLKALVTRLAHYYWAGQLDSSATFEIAEYRGPERRVLLFIQEGC